LSIVIPAFLYANTKPWNDNKWLLARFRSGDIDTLRDVVDNIPEESAAGQFFRGLFEKDGESARFFYDRTVALYSGSPFESYALRRLWQYHWAKGDAEMARRYWNFLKRRHPRHPSVEDIPDFKHTSDYNELTTKPDNNKDPVYTIKGKYWTVQVGAFSDLNRALKVGHTMQRWGDVKYVKKKSIGRDLTAVQVGQFIRREDADKLDVKIRASTELRGRVIAVENN